MTILARVGEEDILVPTQAVIHDLTPTTDTAGHTATLTLSTVAPDHIRVVDHGVGHIGAGPGLTAEAIHVLTAPVRIVVDPEVEVDPMEGNVSIRGETGKDQDLCQ